MTKSSPASKTLTLAVRAVLNADGARRLQEIGRRRGKAAQAGHPRRGEVALGRVCGDARQEGGVAVLRRDEARERKCVAQPGERKFKIEYE